MSENGVELKLRFKGARTYLHGTDLFNRSEEIGGDADVLSPIKSLKIRKIIRHDCDYLPAGVPFRSDRLVATVEHISGAKANIVESDREVKERYPYEEDRVYEDATCFERTITQKRSSGYTPIEEIVALTKRIHQFALPAELGHWMFTGIDLDMPLGRNKGELYMVSIVNVLANKFTVSQIDRDGKPIGRITFAVAES